LNLRNCLHLGDINLVFKKICTPRRDKSCIWEKYINTGEIYVLRKYIHTGEINLAFKKIYTHRGNNYCASEKLHLRTNESLHLGEINLAFEKVKFYTIWKISCHNIFITYFTLTFSKHWLIYCKKDLWTDEIKSLRELPLFNLQIFLFRIWFQKYTKQCRSVQWRQKHKSYKSSSSIIFIITYFVAICSFLHVQ
jgi:hypothetical protein